MPLIGAVADDLTGATTTGVLLARSKARTAVFFNEEAAQEARETASLDAILISSNSRPLPKEEAYDKVKSATNALKAMGVKYFSKRIDTTLRGGVGVEIDAMLDQLNEDTIAVVVPAMPQSRSTDQHTGCTGCTYTGKRELHTKTSCRPDQKKGRTGYIRSGSERKRRNQRSSY